MAVRDLFVYELAEGFTFRALQDDLGSAGLDLANPKSGKVIVLDWEGGAHEITIDRFAELVTQPNSLSFQWWFSELADLYCRIRVLDRTRKIELGLEGTTPLERTRVAMAMESRFLRESQRSIGLVFDPEGWSEDYDWDSFFVSNETLDWSAHGFGAPMTLGIRSEALVRLENLPAGIEIRHENGLTILSMGSEKLLA